MYVCICNNVTDTDIREAVNDGIRDFKTLAEKLGVGSCCGKCTRCARRVLCAAKAEQSSMALTALLPAAMSGSVVLA